MKVVRSRLSFEFVFIVLLMALTNAAVFLYRWIKVCFGKVTIWQVLTHAHEDFSCLSSGQQLVFFGCAAAFVLVSAVLAGLVWWLFGTSWMSRRRWGRWMAILIVAVSYTLPVYCYLDNRLGLSYEIRCRLTPSSFLVDNHTPVRSKDVTFPGGKRNLIVLMVESLEDSFTHLPPGNVNLLPRLSEMRARSLSFSGQRQVFGTGCTIEAETGILLGIPRVMVDGIADNVCWGCSVPFRGDTVFRILLDAGYECAYVQGCDMSFAATDVLLSKTPEIAVTALRQFEEKYGRHSPEVGKVAHDGAILARCREEADRLAASEKPFFLMGVTFDTHAGFEHLPAGAPRTRGDRFEDAYLECDRQIAGFLDWLSGRPYAKDTVVVVLGDHLYMKDFGDRLPYEERQVFNLVTGAGIRAGSVRRTFAAFDWAPTLLELVGGVLPSGRMGLGTSLIRPDAKTVLESVGVPKYEEESRKSVVSFRELVYE